MNINQEVPLEIHRGHFRDCLDHLGAWLSKMSPRYSKDSFETRKPIADFCGVRVQAVQSWFATSNMPLGLPRIRALCYLDLIGYRVIEFERMPKVLRHFSEVLGYGLLTPQEAATQVGFKQASSLYAVIWQKETLSDACSEKMWSIWKARREEIDKKKKSTVKINLPARAFGTAQSVQIALPKADANKAGVGGEDENVRDVHRQVLTTMLVGLSAMLKHSSLLAVDDLLRLSPYLKTILALQVRLNELGSRLIALQEKGGA